MPTHRQVPIFVLGLALCPSIGAQSPDSKPEEDVPLLPRVEVVGSRIRRVDLETSQPVLVLERAQLERTGLDSVGDILQDLTAHGAALNTTVNNGGDGTTRVDLRNLGDQRTLVLVDGRRWITGIDGAVDLNSIPLSIIERIEVLKDGASAIYGTDAIAGVINITTREVANGFEASGRVGEFAQGDGRVETAEATIGTNRERFSAALNISYLKQDPIFARDREISAVPVFGIPGNNINAGASPLTPFGLFGFGVQGVCPFDPSGNYPANGRCPITDGRAPTLNRSTFDPTTNSYRLLDLANDGYNFASENYLQTPQERRALFAHGRYELGVSTEFTFDLLYNERLSAQELAPVPFQVAAFAPGSLRVVVPADHVYNPFRQPVTAVRFRPGGFVRRFNQDADTLRIAAGFSGVSEFASRTWFWKVDGVRAEYKIGERVQGLLDPTRLASALGPSFRDAAGVARCGTPAAIIAGCVPLDPFRGPSGLTREMLDYVYFNAENEVNTRSTSYSASVTGDLFDLPTGPLAIAAGYEYRRETGRSTQDARQAAVDLRQATVYGGTVSADEVYAELSIPLLADLPAARVLELNVAGRWSDYEPFGRTSNLRGGFRWKPIDSLLLRGTRGEGFRAPVVSELFFPRTNSLESPSLDPCNAANRPDPVQRANCIADGVPGGAYDAEAVLFGTTSGGNAALQPETATSTTLGLVWSPADLPDFNVTLDWYRFNIESAIARVAVANVLRFCANAAVPEACARTSRTATGELLNVDVSVLNSGVLEVEGFDLGANWHIDTDLGRFDLQWDSTYSTRYRSEVPRGAGERSALGNNFAFEPGFRVRANLDLAWRRGEWSAAAGLRYYPALDEACIGPSNAGYESLCSRPGIESPTHFGYPENRLGARVYVDLQAAWDAPFGARILLGVHNAFDRDPPVSYAAFANSFDPSYPIPGRYWYLGWQVKL